MTPIYFPFTTISGPVFSALSACFKQIVVYHPSRHHVPETLRRFETSGRLEIRLPVENEKDPISDLLKAYHTWADLHGKERLALEKIHPSQTPFFDETAVTRIRSDIQGALLTTDEATSGMKKKQWALLRARLFLTVAQEHDAHQAGFSADLHKIDQMEKKLFQDLVSDPNDRYQSDAEKELTNSFVVGSPKSDEKLAAWVCLYLNHQATVKTETATPDLFITSDPSVLDTLLMKAEDTDLICRVSDIPFGTGDPESVIIPYNPDIYEIVQQCIHSRPRSSDTDFSFPNVGNDIGRTGLLTIYSVKGDIMSEFRDESAAFSDMSKPSQASAEGHRTLLGSIITHPAS